MRLPNALQFTYLLTKPTVFPSFLGSKSLMKYIGDSHPNVFIENKQMKQVYE